MDSSTKSALFGVLLLASAASAQAQPAFEYSVLHAFEDPVRSPYGNVIQGTDGALYGTTFGGGAWGFGSVFKVHADGSGFATLHEFQGTDGAFPVFGVIQGSDGFLYGITSQGGASGVCTFWQAGDVGACEILFRVSADGSGFQQIHVFNEGGGGSGVIQGTDGFLYGIAGAAIFKIATDGSSLTILREDFGNSSLQSGLIQGSDGSLYGASPIPGTNFNGAIFKIGTDGSGFTILHAFDNTDGNGPTGLVEAADGALYGTTFFSANGGGVVYKLHTDGSGFAVLHEFATSTGLPLGPLVQATDGVLYGTTLQGGAAGAGVIFKIATDGSGFASLREFAGADGAAPQAGLVQGTSGALYGTVSAGGARNRGAVFAINPDGSGFVEVHEFDGSGPANPSATLVRGIDGALYGVTPTGGPNNDGAVFRVAADGSGFTSLHDFSGSDGVGPTALLQGADGVLYGTTRGGGAQNGGVVFKMAADGSGFATIHDFDWWTGSSPNALIQGSDDALYGTTQWGGGNSWGVVFKIGTDGSSYSSLHDFDYSTTGGSPNALLQGADGVIYGTTQYGATGPGTVFRVLTDGSGFAIVHQFPYTGGGAPQALTQGPDGSLYGTTQTASGGLTGTVFKLRTNGSGFVTLHTFDFAGGNAPTSGLAFGADGALYGTTPIGSGNGYGMVYRMAANGTGFSLLHDFQGGADGAEPLAGLVQGADGTLYGSTYFGGSGGGILFRLATQTLSVSNASVVEGDTGTGLAAVTVSLASPATKPVTVHYGTANGTAVAGIDYVSTSGTLTFAPGETTKTVDVTVKGDTLYEADETFSVQLSLATNATIATDEGFVTIVNDDAPPTLSIDSLSTVEGNALQKNVIFTVSLSEASGAATSVHYQTADVTARAGSDYVATSGTLTIPAGSVTRTITVAVKGDTTYEGDETFDVVLDSPVNATIAEGTGVGTIVDDDGVGTFAFSSASYAVSEAAGRATVTVTRSDGAQAGTVRYATSDGTATAGADYTATPGTLTFGAAQKTATIQVPILNDRLSEGSETVLLSLSDPEPSSQGAALGSPSTAVLTILDNDPGGRIQFASANASALESAGSVKLTIKRIGGPASPASVHYAMTDETATGGGVDYDSTAGDVTFDASGPGALTKTISIPITQDALAEGTETFRVTLSSPTGGAGLGSPTVATVTILDDESTVEFSSPTYSAKESFATALVTVKRSGPLAGTATVDYATSDGTATAGEDYKATSGTLTFAPNVSMKTFSVPVTRDSLVEGNETVVLTLSNAAGTGLGETNPSTLTILDDDVKPTLQFSTASYTVNEMTPKAVLVVKRTGNPADVVTVGYAVSGGTATGGGLDYTLDPGTLTFAKGVLVQTILVPIVNDAAIEGTETVKVSLSAEQNVTEAGKVALGTNSEATLNITDSEPTVQFAAATYSANETAKSVLIAVRRVGGITAPATVDYEVTGGTAVPDMGAGGDYEVLPPGTLSFGAGQALKTIVVRLEPDTAVDGTRTIELDLKAPTGAGLGTPSAAVVTIKDDDVAGVVQFSAASYSVSEGAGSATITVSRTAGTASEATIHYATVGGSGSAGTDYDAASGTLTFAANEKSKSFPLTVHDDGVIDSGAVSVDLALDTPGGGLALGATSTATLWIVRR